MIGRSVFSLRPTKMIKSLNLRRRPEALPLASLALPLIAAMAAGCGGGSAATAASPSGGGGGGTTSPAIQTTATFHVDVATGKVTVTPTVLASASKAGALKPQAVFLGDTIGFNSSDLLNEGGTSTGIRTMSVSITNNFGLALGSDPNGVTNGLQVIFSPPINLTTPPNLEGLTNVSTFAGSGASGTTNGAAANATFTSPQGVAINSQGAIFVADAGRIREIQSGAVSTLAGGGTSANPDGLGASAYFGAPVGIAVNPVDGSLIVCDQTLNRVRRVTPAGLVTTIAGTGTAGGNNGAGNVATFSSPTGVAVDAGGNIYVSETTGSRIRKLAFTGGDPTQAANYTVSTVTGTGAVGGTDGPDGVASFHAPYQLALDGNGGLYVADSGNNRIRRVDVTTGAVTTIAGTGGGSDIDANGAVATFNGPRGITWLNGALFVSDYTGQVIRQLTLAPGAPPSSSSNWTVQTLAGSPGSIGFNNGVGAAATFDCPVMLAASPGGSLFIADSFNHMIRRVTPPVGLLPVGVTTGSTTSAPVTLSDPDGFNAAIATGTQLPYLLYGGQLGAGATSQPRLWSFSVPTGVSAFVFTVTVVASTPVSSSLDSAVGAGSAFDYVRTLAGIGVVGHVNGPEAGASFWSGGYLATDAAGDVFVADSGNDDIRRIGANGIVTTVAGATLTAGSANGTGDVATFDNPTGIAVSPDGSTVFVADFGNNVIRRIALTGYDPTVPSNWTVSTIVGVAGSAGGNYVSPTTGDIAKINTPAGLAYDPTDRVLYFTELTGNRVRKASLIGSDPSVAHNWLVELVAGDASQVNGNPGQVNGYFNNARFKSPNGLALDGTNNLYIADAGNYAIRKIGSGGIVETLAGGTSPGYVDGFATSAEFSGPADVAVDATGTVYVSDYENSLVRAVTALGQVTTVAGTGGTGYQNGPGNSAQIAWPIGVALEADGTLLCISDGGADIRAISRSFSNSTVGP